MITLLKETRKAKAIFICSSRWPFANSRGANLNSNWRKIMAFFDTKFASLARRNSGRKCYHISNESLFHDRNNGAVHGHV